MGKHSIRTNVLTTILLAGMSLLGSIFNIPPQGGKDKPYHKDKPTTVAIFGAARLQIPRQAFIHGTDDLAHWLRLDWGKYRLRTVVLDPGHGGKDLGTSSNGYHEKDIALQIAKKLGAHIQTQFPGVKVVYTRDTDQFITLGERARVANQQKADLFLSIHCNAFRQSQVGGLETYVMGPDEAAENMDVIKRENDVVLMEEGYEDEYQDYGVNRSSPLYDILANSYQNIYLEQSLSFASNLDGQFRKSGHKTRGVHQADFLVLRRTAMPSILVETGYLSNATDRKMLTTPKGQEQLAAHLFLAFQNYKTSVEKQPATLEAPVSPLDEGTATAHKEAKASASGIMFHIELLSAKETVDLGQPKWKPLLSQLRIERFPNGEKRYLLGGFGADYTKAASAVQQWQQKGFPTSQIVATHHGQTIPIEKAKEMLRFPAGKASVQP